MDGETGVSNARKASMSPGEGGSNTIPVSSLATELNDVTVERDDALAKLQMIQDEFRSIQGGNYDGRIGQLFLQFREADMEDVGANRRSSGNIGMDDTDYLHEEIGSLRVSLQASEEALADARIALAREREYAEMINQDDDHAAAQAAEMKHQATKLAGVEHDLGSARTLNSELQGQLEEAATLISELEAQVDSVRHDNRDAKQEIAAQAEEINFAANRANDLEEMMLTSQSNREEAQGQVEALQEQLAAEQEGHTTEVGELRDEQARMRETIRARDRKLRKLEDEVESARQPQLESVPSTTNLLARVESLSAEMTTSIPSDNDRVAEETAAAIRLITDSTEYPSVNSTMDLMRVMEEMLSETRSRAMLHAQTERNLKNVQQRLEVSSSTLQTRTALLMKTTRWLEQSAVHLSKYTRMKPADAAKMNESGDDEDSDGTTKKLQDGAEAAHDLMNKTLETLDAKIKELFNAQRTQLSKAAQQHQLALKVKVKEFQTEVAKYRQLVGFPCKYVGCTEAPSPRPSQAQLWECIDRIEKDAVAASPPSPVVVASVPRSSYKGHPWPASMYVRGQDGKVLVSKPYLHFCSVGQVETYVIFVAYTRTARSKGRKFYVHAFGCQSTGDAETLSEMVIRQCEQAHKLNKELQATKKGKDKHAEDHGGDEIVLTSPVVGKKEAKASLGLSALSPTRRSTAKEVKEKPKPKKRLLSKSSMKSPPASTKDAPTKSRRGSFLSKKDKTPESSGSKVSKMEEVKEAPVKTAKEAAPEAVAELQEADAPAGFGAWSKSVV